jgi:A/G-specific adenine glycosylase
LRFHPIVIGSTTMFRRSLLSWYDATARPLPWREPDPQTGRPPAYQVMLSEFMLQQTQVVTVIPYFRRFLEAFPTLTDLADADEQRVMRLWQGLGYYSRARNLHRAALAIRDRFGGRVPAKVDELLSLPGIGRYTAGAIASIAFDTVAPIVDGNVARVVVRLDQIEADAKSKPVVDQLWQRATEFVDPRRPGAMNSALMELGATVCVPKRPMCMLCPVVRCCQAHASNRQDAIPAARATRVTPLESRTIYCIYRKSKRSIEYAFEQRPATGRWAGMWQFITRDDKDSIRSVRSIETLQTFRHQLTHRLYEFRVLRCKARPGAGWAWHTLEASESLPLPLPHVRAREMLREIGSDDA